MQLSTIISQLNLIIIIKSIDGITSKRRGCANGNIGRVQIDKIIFFDDQQCIFIILSGKINMSYSLGYGKKTITINIENFDLAIGRIVLSILIFSPQSLEGC